jgi:hypothetical protein
MFELGASEFRFVPAPGIAGVRPAFRQLRTGRPRSQVDYRSDVDHRSQDDRRSQVDHRSQAGGGVS